MATHSSAIPAADLRVVPMTAGDAERFQAADMAAFFFDPASADVEIDTAHIDWSRAFGVEREGEPGLAGIYASYPMCVTVPGAVGGLTTLPMAGLSWVSVHPDHRRRGILRTMMRHHLDWLHDRGEYLGGLLAAEVGIYGRFGYAVASLNVQLTAPRSTELVAPALDDRAAAVSTRMLPADSDDVAELLYDAQRRCAAGRLGDVTRPLSMIRPGLRDRPARRVGREPLQVMFARTDGEVTGYAVLQRQVSWSDVEVAQGTVHVHELSALDSASLLALARRLLDLDLTTTTKIANIAIDSPLVWWAGGPRGLDVRVTDSLWLRLLDVPVALHARGYAAPCDLVLDITDDLCPWNAGAWRFQVGDDGAGTCSRSNGPADVRLPVQALGAAYLGSRTLTAQVSQGVVHEVTAGSVHRLSSAFAADREPVGSVGF